MKRILQNIIVLAGMLLPALVATVSHAARPEVQATPRPTPHPTPTALPAAHSTPTVPAARPTTIPAGMPTPQPGGGVKATPRPPEPKATPRPTPQVTPGPVLPVEIQLASGARLVLKPDHTAPRVACALVVRAGMANESATNAGWRRLLADTMLRGIQHGDQSLDGVGVQQAAEDLNASLGGEVGPDVMEFWVQGDSTTVTGQCRLLCDLVLHPSLKPDDIDLVKRSLLVRQRLAQFDVAEQTLAAMRAQIYHDPKGQLTGYALNSLGTPDSVQHLTPDLLRGLSAQYLVPANWTIAMTGNFNPAEVAAWWQQQALPSGLMPPPIVPVTKKPQTEVTPVVREMPSQDALLMVSFQVPGIAHGDHTAIALLASALGDSSAARLPSRLMTGPVLPALGVSRTISQVTVQHTVRRFDSELVVLIQANAQAVDQAKNALLVEIRRLQEAPLSEAELLSAKRYLLGAWATDREGLHDRAFHLAWPLALGAPDDTLMPSQIRAVGVKDVQRVAKQYLQNYTVGLIMPHS